MHLGAHFVCVYAKILRCFIMFLLKPIHFWDLEFIIPFHYILNNLNHPNIIENRFFVFLSVRRYFMTLENVKLLYNVLK